MEKENLLVVNNLMDETRNPDLSELSDLFRLSVEKELALYKEFNH